jgi:phosphoribosylformylglycinamidine synthase subunit PurQ / glutaminase
MKKNNQTPPSALILAGYGLNCELETAHAFELAGAETAIIHVNQLLAEPKLLKKFQILAIPGGFSYGDDIGSGRAFALKLKNNIWSQLQKFIEDDKLVIGIRNGFQILVNLGLLPATAEKYGQIQVSLQANNLPRYTTRWVDLQSDSDSPWLKNITHLSLPIAHGEGKFVADRSTLAKLDQQKQVAARYTHGQICENYSLPANPNGSENDVAAVTDPSGKILGLMPHPERAVYFTQLPDWQLQKIRIQQQGNDLPKYGPGLKLFKNSVNYFK